MYVHRLMPFLGNLHQNTKMLIMPSWVYVCVGFANFSCWVNVDKTISSHEKKRLVAAVNGEGIKNSWEKVVGRKKIPAYLQKP